MLDIAIYDERIAIIIDGCFWHVCPDHGTLPKSNQDWWLTKLARNVVRDSCLRQALRMHGWTVIRHWEHDDPARTADALELIIAGS